MKNPQTIELHVEELVLHGFASGHRYSISETMQQELARLIEAHGVPASLMDRATIAVLNTNSVNLDRGGKPETIGTQVAQSIYGAFK